MRREVSHAKKREKRRGERGIRGVAIDEQETIGRGREQTFSASRPLKRVLSECIGLFATTDL